MENQSHVHLLNVRKGKILEISPDPTFNFLHHAKIKYENGDIITSAYYHNEFELAIDTEEYFATYLMSFPIDSLENYYWVKFNILLKIDPKKIKDENTMIAEIEMTHPPRTVCKPSPHNHLSTTRNSTLNFKLGDKFYVPFYGYYYDASNFRIPGLTNDELFGFYRIFNEPPIIIDLEFNYEGEIEWDSKIGYWYIKG